MGMSIFGHLLMPLAGLFIPSLRKKKSATLSGLLHYFTPFYMPLIMAVLVLKQPDMGTAGMILIFPGLLYIIAGMPLLEILLSLGISFILFIGLAIVAPYRMARLVVLLHPEDYAQGMGYQTMQSLIAVGSGGVLGQGMGKGSPNSSTCRNSTPTLPTPCSARNMVL